MQDNILSFELLNKHFPGVHALKDVSFQVREGDVHGLCGENGAGKSTLMKILSGVYPHSEYDGKVFFKGKELRLESSAIHSSKKLGIGIVYQELSLIPQLTVGENIFLGREPTKRLGIDWHQLHADTTKLLERYRVNIPPREKVQNLSVGKQQLVEIMKAISENASLLILDEPTSALSEAEIAQLLDIIRTLKQHDVTCIYITHKLEEIFAITDRTTVIRDGQVIETRDTGELSPEQLIALLVGRKMKERFPKKTSRPGETILKLHDLKIQDPYNPANFSTKNVTFDLRKGEILGIAGLMGSGRTELVRGLFGEYGDIVGGRIEIRGKTQKIRSSHEAMQQGIFLVPEDRKREGLILMQSILQNISLPTLDKFSRFCYINRSRELYEAEQYAKQLAVKAPSVLTSVGTLSGGNQQKVVISKALMVNPQILIFDDPTRGIDVGAKYEIYKIMNQLAEKGMAIIMISSSLEEIFGMSDRILVLCEGESTALLHRKDANQEIVMSYAVGLKKEEIHI